MMLGKMCIRDSSEGLTLAQLAERMQALGCRTALNLDGGGSTAAGVTYPGYASGATANVPSDGKLRECANFIFLVRQKKDAGTASKQMCIRDSYTLEEYFCKNFDPGILPLFTGELGFTDEELEGEFRFWQDWLRTRVPKAYPGIREILERHRAAGGIIAVVSHRCV